MKVVINTCYGGFRLSHEAQRMLAKLKGKEVFFYIHSQYKHNTGIDEYKRVENPTAEAFVFSLTSNLGDIANSLDGADYLDEYQINRADKDLISVVETLGDRANSGFSDLKVVEIPDNTEYEIEEYNGNEWIAEKHRTWR